MSEPNPTSDAAKVLMRRMKRGFRFVSVTPFKGLLVTPFVGAVGSPVRFAVESLNGTDVLLHDVSATIEDLEDLGDLPRSSLSRIEQACAEHGVQVDGARLMVRASLDEAADAAAALLQCSLMAQQEQFHLQPNQRTRSEKRSTAWKSSIEPIVSRWADARDVEVRRAFRIEGGARKFEVPFLLSDRATSRVAAVDMLTSAKPSQVLDRVEARGTDLRRASVRVPFALVVRDDIDLAPFAQVFEDNNTLLVPANGRVDEGRLVDALQSLLGQTEAALQ